MATSKCPSCGAPTTSGSSFCIYCGATLASSSPPLSSSAAPQAAEPAAFQAPDQFQPPAPQRKHSRVLIIVLVIVVVAIVVVAAFVILAPAPYPIQVQDINIWAPDNVCGLNSNPSYFTGWNGSTSQVQTFDFGMPNYNSTSCTIVSVVTNTSGFKLSDIQVPLTIPGGDTAGASMNITIKSPSSDFNGYLNLVFS